MYRQNIFQTPRRILFFVGSIFISVNAYFLLYHQTLFQFKVQRAASKRDHFHSVDKALVYNNVNKLEIQFLSDAYIRERSLQQFYHVKNIRNDHNSMRDSYYV